MWRGQLPHALMFLVLLPGAFALAGSSILKGTWLGVHVYSFFVWALAVPVLQQVAVAAVWRGQLCHRVLTRPFGDAGFVVWGAIFMPLLVLRPLLVLAVGIADLGSLGFSPPVGWISGGLLLLPALWAMHSVLKYFGIPRALGADHFFERYRAMPMVRGGAFAHSANAMYSFVFLGLWGVALITGSRAALAVAAFQHAYIWVHWYCTEQPDGVVLYGRSQDEDD